MKAICLEKPREFRIVDLPDAQPPGPGEAQVKVHRVGICGTDISGYLGKFPFYSYPRIPGHELGVEVIAVGPGVTHVAPGDRCSVEPYINREDSFASLRGRPNCCEELQVLGVHVDGGMRPFFNLPARKLHRSDRLDLDQLALVETLAIGCHAVQRAALAPGEQVLIIGAGPIGLSVVEFARLAGAHITVMDLAEHRLRFCREVMGVHETIVNRGNASEVEQLRGITEGNLATTVFDATGNAKSMSQAVEFAAHTGRVVFVGITTDLICFPHPLVHRRELTLLASRNAVAAEFRQIIQVIEQGRLDTRPWITHHFDFLEVPQRFDELLRPESGAIKAIVDVTPIGERT